MDGSRFDRLVRLASTTPTRRAALASVLAAGLGLAVAAGEVDAKQCVAVGKRCKRKGKPNKTCCGGAKCKSAKCACPSGLTNCADACVNISSDPANCGGCGNTCAPNDPCIGGICL